MFELETISETLCGGSITLKLRVLFASRCVDPHCIDTKFRLYCLPENPSANPCADTQCGRRPNTTDPALTQRQKDTTLKKVRYYGYPLLAAAFVAQFVSLGIYSYVLGSFMGKRFWAYRRQLRFWGDFARLECAAGRLPRTAGSRAVEPARRGGNSGRFHHQSVGKYFE